MVKLYTNAGFYIEIGKTIKYFFTVERYLGRVLKI